MRWNCGETKPLVRLRISVTDCMCLGDGPRYTPSLALASHFEMDLFAASGVKAGQPNCVCVWGIDLLLLLLIFVMMTDYCLEKALCYLHNIQFWLHSAIVMYGWPLVIWLSHEVQLFLPVLVYCKWLSQRAILMMGIQPTETSNLFLLCHNI